MLLSRYIKTFVPSLLISYGTLLADDPSLLDDRPYDEQFLAPAPPPFELPWLTGPLLTPNAHAIPLGHMNIEPYFYANTAYGIYDRHWRTHPSKHNFYNYNVAVPAQFGFAPRMDVQIVPQFSWNHTHGTSPSSASDWVLNDLPFAMDLQIVYDDPKNWYPAVKLQFFANVPWGKFRHLDPDKLGTDIGGSGSWLPGFSINMSRLFHFTGTHFLATRWFTSYVIPSSVVVSDYNTYGGGYGTRGTVYPGPTLSAGFGLEYTLSQTWALAFDALYSHSAKTRFSGHAGSTGGVPNSIGGPSSEHFSIAPAIEYNWSPNYGVIAGAWFSLAGRNSSEFANGVIALNIYK